jgi:multidrug resistance efflux pump
MGYQEEVASVVAARRDELEADLEAAKRIVESLRAQLTEAERRVQSYESLLAFDADDARSPGEIPIGHVTLHVAMQMVLKDAPNQSMRPADLVAAIHARGLYRMRDGRPVETQQIHARVGNYENLFERDGTFIKLR